MNNFNDARKDAYNKLSIHEDIKVIDKNLLEKGFGDFAEVWEVKKEITDTNGIGKELTFYLCLRNSFPLSLPSLYLTKHSYDLVKYLPHVNSSQLICTYDSETTRTNPNNPYGIVLACLQRGRAIIEAGLRKENLKDFEDEFLSYWECQFEEKLKVNESIMSLIEESPLTVEVRLLQLEKKLFGFSHILYQESIENARFLKFIEDAARKYKEVELLYIDELDISNIPPFDISNRDAINKIGGYSNERHRELIGKLNKSGRLFVLFKKTVKGEDHYLGWFHSNPNTSQAGFRPGTLTKYSVLTKMAQSVEKVERISPRKYTNKRINRRTAGLDNINNYKFLIVGVGSIGSNLLYFLNSLSYPELRLIDYDSITIENLGRHLLGMNYLNFPKTIGAKNHLLSINPKQSILTKELELTEVYENDKTFINDSDFLFIVTGKLNIENWLAEKIKQGEINKPAFIIWVEPYLAGGHCIYIHPQDFKYSEYYHTLEGSTFFNNNIINDKEYNEKKELITLKEAGCQSSFTPYSGCNVVLFLSALYPTILKIIRGNCKKSFCISWVGDKEILNDLGLELSDFGNKRNSFDLVEYGI
jgi:ThiF family/Prokaryotic E2 family B